MQLTTSVAVETVVPVLYRATSACMLIKKNDVHVRDDSTGLMRVTAPWNL